MDAHIKGRHRNSEEKNKLNTKVLGYGKVDHKEEKSVEILPSFISGWTWNQVTKRAGRGGS